jgi:carbamoyl-phosphate synthase large subunit
VGDTKRNILITSAGKRVVLTEMFKKTLLQYIEGGAVYTTDMNPTLAPAGYVSDGCIKVPAVMADNYVDLLFSKCVEYRIGMVIPTIDTELLLLAENRVRFKEAGIDIIVSDASFIHTCRDKRNTPAFFRSRNIATLREIDKMMPTFPFFAKPYDGSSSKDIHVVRNAEELTPEIQNNPKLIYMEYIDKNEYKEFTVDMYYGRDHRVKSIVPRERVEIRAGEINKGYTRKNYIVNFLKERMDYVEGAVGCICLQLFYKESTNEIVGIEINPRFGGGYPLAYYAHADYPKNLIREYFFGDSIAYTDDWADNMLMLRYDANVIVNAEGRCI